MPNFVKSKFTGMLKGLLRRFDDGDTQTAPAPMPARTAANTAPAPAATPPPRPQAVPPAPAISPARAKTAGDLQLPLQPIIASLPMELRAKIAQPPAAGTMFSVPIDKVLSQLAHGTVKITFGELRLAVPGLFINSGGDNDSRPVILPLNLILAQISPSLLARRPAPKLEVSDEIIGPFGTRAEGVNFTSTPTKAAPAPLPKSEAPAAPLTPLPVTPPPTFTPRTAPAPAPAAPAPAARTAPVATPPLPKPAAAASPKPVAPAPTKPAAPAPVAPPPSPKPVATAPPAPPSAPAQASVPAPEPPAPVVEPSAPIPFSLAPGSSAGGFNSAPQIPIAAEATVTVPLAALSETWPDALKMEIVQTNLSGAQVALPLSLIEPGLKRGRITVAWKNLRGMIRPTPPPVSIHDSVEVELPLKVVAPLFFSSQKSAGPAKQKIISPSAEIPNLFSGSKHSEPTMAPLPTPTTPPPAPTSGSAASSWGDLFTAPAGTPAPARTVTASAPTGLPPAQLKSEDTNYYAKGETAAGVSDTEFRRQASPGTDFLTRGASPKEIIAQTVALPGVTGAVIALPDGLKVASQVPAEFNADMLAAFLPQIFARTGQSTKELRMGELNNLSFTVGNVPWKIFRVNAVYFAAFGRAGEPLPTAQLASLAVLLDRKNK